MFKLLTPHVLFGFGGIVGWSGSDQPYMSTHMRPVPLFDMQLLLNKSGFAGVYLSHFSWTWFDESSPCRRLKGNFYIIVVVLHR